MAEVWIALTDIHLGGGPDGSSFALAYRHGNVVPDSVVARFGWDAQGFVERVTIEGDGQSPEWWKALDPATQSELDAVIEEVGRKVYLTDPRLTDDRVPLPGSIRDVHVDGDANVSADKLVEGVTNKLLRQDERDKLAGIAAMATRNTTDDLLRDRTTHTGEQPIASVTGLQDALDAKASLAQLGDLQTVVDGKAPLSHTHAAADIIGNPGDLGAGTTLPTGGMSRGDAFYHTGLGCLMIYTGTQWLQATVPSYADAAVRGAVPTAELYRGFRAYQDDRRWELQWSGTGWIVVGGVLPGVRLVKGNTQSFTNAWQALTWSSPPPAPIGFTYAMFTSANPTKLTVPIRGRWRAVAGAFGVTNLQLRVDAVGYPATNPTSGTMIGAVSNMPLSAMVTCSADEVVLDAGSYVEVYGYSSSTQTGGTTSGYTAHFSLSYIGPA